jgi:hypothetical protein
VERHHGDAEEAAELDCELNRQSRRYAMPENIDHASSWTDSKMGTLHRFHDDRLAGSVLFAKGVVNGSAWLGCGKRECRA